MQTVPPKPRQVVILPSPQSARQAQQFIDMAQAALARSGAAPFEATIWRNPANYNDLRVLREALREIKSDPRFNQIRIVVLTTSKAEEDIYKTYELSAASYIMKPVTFGGLIDVVTALGKYWLEIVELPGDGNGGGNG